MKEMQYDIIELANSGIILTIWNLEKLQMQFAYIY